jgi:hypothetical protein
MYYHEPLVGEAVLCHVGIGEARTNFAEIAVSISLLDLLVE